MKKIIFLCLLSILAMPVAAFAQNEAVDAAASTAPAPLQFSNAYAFATAPAQTNGAVFLTIVNGHETDDRLLSAATSVADTVQLHTMKQEEGVMIMREAENGFELKAGETLKLEPTGNHIMLMGLKAPLAQGSTFPITLVFEKEPPQTLQVEVVAPGSTARLGQE